MAIRIEDYIRGDGSNPFKAWFDGLDPQAAAKKKGSERGDHRRSKTR